MIKRANSNGNADGLSAGKSHAFAGSWCEAHRYRASTVRAAGCDDPFYRFDCFGHFNSAAVAAAVLAGTAAALPPGQTGALANAPEKPAAAAAGAPAPAPAAAAPAVAPPAEGSKAAGKA